MTGPFYGIGLQRREKSSAVRGLSPQRMTPLLRQLRTILITAALMAAPGVPVAAQDAGQQEFAAAYKALAQKDYDNAIALFRRGLADQTGNTAGDSAAHKDLAYTLLKTGDSTEARDEFEAALHANEHDDTAALEYAFLAYETQKPIEARRIFDRLRKRGNVATRTTAEEAFQNIDRPLAEGIARWQQAVSRLANPNDLSTFSAHWELAHLAELRDNLPLAAEQYEICRKLKPQLSEMLLILARVWQQLNRVEEARTAILAASRERNPRAAEQGREQWGARYPYPYEFVQALQIDPENVDLRRELAFLYLAMRKQPEAVDQFEKVLAIDPQDALSRDQLDALLSGKQKAPVPTPVLVPVVSNGQPLVPATAMDAKKMGERSLALGYARDAIKYLRQAHDEHPEDAEVMLKLGWAYNFAKDDQDEIGRAHV